MASSDTDSGVKRSLVMSSRNIGQGTYHDLDLGPRTGVRALGGYYVNGMYYSREEVVGLANGEQRTLSID